MTDYSLGLYMWTGWAVQFSLFCWGIAALFKWVFYQPSRWRMDWQIWRKRGMPTWFVRMWRADRSSPALQERSVLLTGCGFSVDPSVYLAFRRMAIAAAVIVTAAGLGIHVIWGGVGAWWKPVMFAASFGCLAYFDRAILRHSRKYRVEKIRRELIAVSSQLLYYTNSRLHLHGKLMKCLPLTRTLRGDLGYLLNEWYHDPDGALQRFKERLGTDEAYGFAECLRSLRLHESDEIYHLLRELVQEYKAKLELARESRKESASYVLFVLAGIPILYTFQIFLHPWVQEAARLFASLNS